VAVVVRLLVRQDDLRRAVLVPVASEDVPAVVATAAVLVAVRVVATADVQVVAVALVAVPVVDSPVAVRVAHLQAPPVLVAAPQVEVSARRSVVRDAVVATWRSSSQRK
jgi:hypothetical protein